MLPIISSILWFLFLLVTAQASRETTWGPEQDVSTASIKRFLFRTEVLDSTTASSASPRRNSSVEKSSLQQPVRSQWPTNHSALSRQGHEANPTAQVPNRFSRYSRYHNRREIVMKNATHVEPNPRKPMEIPNNHSTDKTFVDAFHKIFNFTENKSESDILLRGSRKSESVFMDKEVMSYSIETTEPLPVNHSDIDKINTSPSYDILSKLNLNSGGRPTNESSPLSDVNPLSLVVATDIELRVKTESPITNNVRHYSIGLSDNISQISTDITKLRESFTPRRNSDNVERSSTTRLPRPNSTKHSERTLTSAALDRSTLIKNYPNNVGIYDIKTTNVPKLNGEMTESRLTYNNKYIVSPDDIVNNFTTVRSKRRLSSSREHVIWPLEFYGPSTYQYFYYKNNRRVSMFLTTTPPPKLKKLLEQHVPLNITFHNSDSGDLGREFIIKSGHDDEDMPPVLVNEGLENYKMPFFVKENRRVRLDENIWQNARNRGLLNGYALGYVGFGDLNTERH